MSPPASKRPARRLPAPFLAWLVALPLLLAGLGVAAAFLSVGFELGPWRVGAEKEPSYLPGPQGFSHSRAWLGPPEAPELVSDTWSFQVHDFFWAVNRTLPVKRRAGAP